MTAATQKAYIGMGMEGPIARWYEKTTRKDMDEFRKLAARLRDLLPNGGDVLEVAPGPGFLSVELARTPQLRITALEISRTFVEIARRNAAVADVTVNIVQGNAAAMPFADSSFDLLVCRAAFKNFAEPAQALREMRRVLRPGGRALIADLCKDVSMTEINRYFDRIELSAWDRWFTRIAFRLMLLKRAYTVDSMQALIAPIGFSKTRIDSINIGMEIWLEK
ncbi:MAG: class I SAM-dependent methyltransferase [Acidobacteriaceae bacterium]|jgi:ubiquinone/menaquinone biosynthesis C-methylase UbiE